MHEEELPQGQDDHGPRRTHDDRQGGREAGEHGQGGSQRQLRRHEVGFAVTGRQGRRLPVVSIKPA